MDARQSWLHGTYGLGRKQYKLNVTDVSLFTKIHLDNEIDNATFVCLACDAGCWLSTKLEQPPLTIDVKTTSQTLVIFAAERWFYLLASRVFRYSSPSPFPLWKRSPLRVSSHLLYRSMHNTNLTLSCSCQSR